MPIYILDVERIKRLGQVVDDTGQTMADIDWRVVQYLGRVRESLEQKLAYIQRKLNEAEALLSEAERAESLCHSKQHRNSEGELVPSCSLEEYNANQAHKIVQKWREKYNKAQQIYNDCRYEIDSFLIGGHRFIDEMCNRQTPEISQLINTIYTKMNDILKSPAS